MTYFETLFHQLIRIELEVLIKALEKLEDSELTKNQKNYKDMCLGSLKHEMDQRYLQWEKNEDT